MTDVLLRNGDVEAVNLQVLSEYVLVLVHTTAGMYPYVGVVLCHGRSDLSSFPIVTIQVRKLASVLYLSTLRITLQELRY